MHSSGVRGPRAPPQRRLPRMSSTGSALPRDVSGHSESATSAHETSQEADSDVDIPDDQLALPSNIRDLRALAAERRRRFLDSMQASHSTQESAPAPAEQAPEEEAQDTLTPSTEETQDQTAQPSPRPLPPLSTAVPLPSLSQPRRSLPQPDFSTFRGTATPTGAIPRSASLTWDIHRHQTPTEAPTSTTPDSAPAEVENRSPTPPTEATPVEPVPQGPATENPAVTTPDTAQPGEQEEAQDTADQVPDMPQRDTRRRSTNRARRRSANSTLLAALSTQTGTGPGVLLPSLYGYFTDEPAPSYLRSTGSMHRHGAGPEGETRGRVHPMVAERIMASGPSVSNLHPSTSRVTMSPGVERRVEVAKLRNVHVQPGSVIFPAGTMSDLVSSESNEVQYSRKFEENSILSFSWMLDDVVHLQEEIDHGSKADSGGGKSDVWNLQPLFGHEQWRVEFTRKSVRDPTLSPSLQRRGGRALKKHALALHLSYLGLTGLPFKGELPTSIMLGIRPAVRGEHPLREKHSDFLWREFFSFTFQQDEDTLTYDNFPNLATLLSTSPISDTHALDFVVQIATGPSVLPERDVRGSHTDAGMRLPFYTSESVAVPRGLLTALGSLVDDASTGDIMISVREKGFEQAPTDELAVTAGLKTFVQPWPTGTALPLQVQSTRPLIYVRDRVLWAHTPVLRERSEFFATMIDSHFTEGVLHETPLHGASGRSRDPWRRPYRMLRIPGADFVTMYWFLHYLYTGHVEFMHDEDIQAVTLDDHWILDPASPSARPDWKWRPVEEWQEWDDNSFLPVTHAADPLLSEGYVQRAEPPAEASQRSPDKGHAVGDPHMHPPMLPVPPASALSMYRLAHRYHVPSLCDLAMTHVVAHLTPENATNYLLCTALFEQLQQSIRNYIFQHWQAVSSSPQFEHCCDQVSTGEWGPLAGRALASLMRQLRHTSAATASTDAP
ncbi:hypothetical protein ACI68E_003678 [Malassezia pachydermatis]